MGKRTKFARVSALVLLLALLVTALPCQLQAADAFKINLKNNQTFYLLPGTDILRYKVTVNAAGLLGDQTCSSSNLSVADIDNMGNMTVNDAGSTTITVSVGSKKVTRTIRALRYTDWTQIVSVKNRAKLSVKNQVCSMKLTNKMNFPLKLKLHYNTIADSGSIINADQKTSDIYLPASKSLTYKMMAPEGITMISVTDAELTYDQFGLKSIDAKKVTMKESIAKKDAQTRVVTEAITNKNKNGVILPYHLYLYDKDNHLISVEYHFIGVSGKQKTSLSYTYKLKDKYLDSYIAKVKYKFETPIPFF